MQHGEDPPVYVPYSLRQSYMDFYHNHPLSGHLGFHKVLEKLRIKYYWPRMRESVSRHLLLCTTCQSIKSPNYKAGALSPITFSNPFELVEWDLTGPFHPSLKGNKYILVITDYLTHWCEATSLPNNSAKTVAEALLHKIGVQPWFPRRTTLRPR